MRKRKHGTCSKSCVKVSVTATTPVSIDDPVFGGAAGGAAAAHAAAGV